MVVDTRQRMRALAWTALGVVLLLITVATAAHAQTILTSGQQKMGVQDNAVYGVIEDPQINSVGNAPQTGIRFVAAPIAEEYEMTRYHNGWGIGFNLTQSSSGPPTSGCANGVSGSCGNWNYLEADPPTGVAGSTLVSHTYLLDAPGGNRLLHIEHDYRPSTAPNVLWESEVRVTNIHPTDTFEDIVYRRWQDARGEPTQGIEGDGSGIGTTYLTFDGAVPPPPSLLYSSNRLYQWRTDPAKDPTVAGTGGIMGTPGVNGWNCWNPDPTAPGLVEGPGNTALSLWATAPSGYIGPIMPACRQSINFDLLLGDLEPGETRRFWMYTGGAGDRDTVDAALGTVEAEFWAISSSTETGAAVGEPATFTLAFKGFAPPVVDFDWSFDTNVPYTPPEWNAMTPCAGQDVTFEDQSSPPPGRLLASADWLFGDGGSATGPPGGTVVHNYASPGTYTVTLTVEDDIGSGMSATKTIVVVDCTPPNFPPVIDVPCQSVKADQTVRFHVRAFDPNSAPDPVGHYTLTFSAAGLPGNATFDPETGLFEWTATPGGAPDLVFRVQDAGSPPLSDEAPACITVTIEESAPESGDADGDGAPDGMDNCPFTPNDDQKDSTGNGRGDACDPPPEKEKGPEADPPPCDLLMPFSATGRLRDGEALIAWEYLSDCPIVAFRIQGTSELLVVPWERDGTQIAILEEEGPGTYWIQPLQADDDTFNATLAVAVEVDALACTDCNATSDPDVPDVDGVDPPDPNTGSAREATRALPWILAVAAALAVGLLGFALWRRRRAGP